MPKPPLVKNIVTIAFHWLQVQLVREPGRLSEPLVLDTHQASPLLPVPQVVVSRGHPGFEAVAGVAAALLLFAALLLLASSRRLSSEPESCKEVEDLDATNYFKCNLLTQSFYFTLHVIQFFVVLLFESKRCKNF